VFIKSLGDKGKKHEAEALRRALDISQEPKYLGGLELDVSNPLGVSDRDAILFWVESWLEAINSAERARRLRQPLAEAPIARRGMTLTEKILAHHSIGQISPEGLKSGDFLRLAIDWVAASEISYFVGFSHLA
jgi:hypothetical protein